MNPQQPGQQPDPLNQNPNVQNLPTQQPEIYNSPSLSNLPYGSQPAPQPQNALESISSSDSTSKSRKGLFIVAIVGGVLIVVLLVVVLIINSGGDSQSKSSDKQQNTNATQTLEPAQSLEIEQINNSITQDLSSLDDEKDFPESSLNDKTLGL